MKLLILILFPLLWILEAIWEGVENRGKKELSKIIQTIGTIVIFGIIYFALKFYYNFWLFFYWASFYLITRTLLFGRVWNLAAGQKWSYLGTGWYDRNIERVIRIPAVYFALLFLLAITICEYIIKI